MAETLDTLAEKITALTTSMDNGFGAVDKRFCAVDRRFDAVDRRFDAVDRRFDAVDQRFDEVKSELRTHIEAVDAKVGLVLEKVDDLIKRDARHSVKHAQYELHLDNHELRLIALEPKQEP